MKPRERIIFAVMVLFILPIGVLAIPETADDAKQLVVAWLRRDQRPLGALLGERVTETQTFKDDKGELLYHVVYLAPSGFVIVPADDLVEPIIAFVSQGRFDPSVKNPLGAMVSGDVPARVARARALRAATPNGHFLKARDKWQRLRGMPLTDTNTPPVPDSVSSVSDLRIAPLVRTLWNQGTVNGLACFNYYTPPYAAWAPSNYVCGCVATALCQLLDYFQYPTAGVGTNAFTITVDGIPRTARLRGGDGLGGPYCWSNMPPNPIDPTVAQCQAIGALTYDAGLSVSMGYSATGSGAYLDPLALVQTFMYSNALCAWASNASVFDGRLVSLLNANLDARLPVVFGLNGHAVVCDGYGYYLSTLYHHVNMGWGGADNAWYALPLVDGYTNVCSLVYNIFTNSSGEIISGRVTAGNVPLAGVTVTATRVGGGIYTTTSGTNGIYAFAPIPSGSQYALTVSPPNFVPASTNCSTGRSLNNANSSGDVWGMDFSLVPGVSPPLITAQPQDQRFVDLGGTAGFNVSALTGKSHS